MRVRSQKSVVTCPYCLLYWTVLYMFSLLQKELCTLKLPLTPPCPCAVIFVASVIWKSFFLSHLVSFILNYHLVSHSIILPSIKRYISGFIFFY